MPRAPSDYSFFAAYVRNSIGDHPGHLIGYSAALFYSIFRRVDHSKPTSISRTAASHASQQRSSASVSKDRRPYASIRIRHREAGKAKTDFEATEGSSSSRGTTTTATTRQRHVRFRRRQASKNNACTKRQVPIHRDYEQEAMPASTCNQVKANREREENSKRTSGATNRTDD